MSIICEFAKSKLLLALSLALLLSGAFVLTCKQQLTAHAESQSSLIRSLGLRSLAASSSPSFYMEIAHTQHAVINANNNNNNCVTTPKKGHGIARQVNSLSLSYSILNSFNCNLLWMACWSHSSCLLQFPLRLAFLMKNLKNIYDLINIFLNIFLIHIVSCEHCTTSYFIYNLELHALIKPTIIIYLYKLHLKCFLPSFPFRIQAHSRALHAVGAKTRATAGSNWTLFITYAVFYSSVTAKESAKRTGNARAL